MSEDHFCSFCGRHKDFVVALVTGQKARICDECIKTAQRQVDDYLKKKSENADI